MTSAVKKLPPKPPTKEDNAPAKSCDCAGGGAGMVMMPMVLPINQESRTSKNIRRKRRRRRKAKKIRKGIAWKKDVNGRIFCGYCDRRKLLEHPEDSEKKVAALANENMVIKCPDCEIKNLHPNRKKEIDREAKRDNVRRPILFDENTIVVDGGKEYSRWKRWHTILLLSICLILVVGGMIILAIVNPKPERMKKTCNCRRNRNT